MGENSSSIAHLRRLGRILPSARRSPHPEAWRVGPLAHLAALLRHRSEDSRMRHDVRRRGRVAKIGGRRGRAHAGGRGGVRDTVLEVPERPCSGHSGSRSAARAGGHPGRPTPLPEAVAAATASARAAGAPPRHRLSEGERGHRRAAAADEAHGERGRGPRHDPRWDRTGVGRRVAAASLRGLLARPPEGAVDAASCVDDCMHESDSLLSRAHGKAAGVRAPVKRGCDGQARRRRSSSACVVAGIDNRGRFSAANVNKPGRYRANDDCEPRTGCREDKAVIAHTCSAGRRRRRQDGGRGRTRRRVNLDRTVVGAADSAGQKASQQHNG